MAKTLKRVQNYVTRYFIADASLEKTALDSAWKELAEGITTIEEESDEESETFEYYSHRGSKEEVVGSVAKKYSVEGHRMFGDEAQDMIANMEWETGAKRNVWLRVVDANKNAYVGKATVSEVVVRGGDANGYAPIKFGVSFNGKPEKSTAEL